MKNESQMSKTLSELKWLWAVLQPQGTTLVLIDFALKTPLQEASFWFVSKRSEREGLKIMSRLVGVDIQLC